MNIWDWQISSGTIAELLRPATFTLAALVSTWTLFDARRCRFGSLAVAAWTLLNLLVPPITLPLYFIARSFIRRHAAGDTHAPDRPEMDGGQSKDVPTKASAQTAPEDARREEEEEEEKPRRRYALPLLYALALAASGAFYFYLDYQSFDARLVRAQRAKLYNRQEQAIREYRSALALEEDAHTRKLLGVELANAGRIEEALPEFLAAERGGEPDEQLSFQIASAFDALGQTAEAAHAYQKFLQSRLCAQTLPDSRCDESKARLQVITEQTTP